jgi:hypothetical protein
MRFAVAIVVLISLAAPSQAKMSHEMSCHEMRQMHHKMMGGKHMTCKEMMRMHQMMRTHHKMMGGHHHG